jgi:PAS domain S-box-containing protein
MIFGRAVVSPPSLESRLAVICDSIPEIAYWCDPDGCCRYVNQAFRDYAGVTRGLTGYSWQNMVHPSDIAPVQARLLESRISGKPYIHCFRLRDFRGMYRWFSTRSYPLHNPRHETAVWIGITSDVNHLVGTGGPNLDEWRVTADPESLLDGSNSIFEVLDPSGRRSEVVCQFGVKVFETLEYSPLVPVTQLRWRVRKITNLPPDAFPYCEQTLRVDCLASLFSTVLSELGWPEIPHPD